MGFKDLKNKLFPSDFDDDPNYYEDEGAETEIPQRLPPQPQQQAYQAPAGVAIASRSSSIEMKVVTPERYESVTSIADLLRSNKTVLLNLEKTNKEVARRLIDFLSGVAYALGGDVQKVADNTFAITPSNVAVSNDNVEQPAAEEAPAEQL